MGNMTERFAFFLIEKIMLPLFVWVVLPLLLLVLFVGVPWMILSGGSDKAFVCAHTPHFGKCQEAVTMWVYNAATKTSMPQTHPCGCVSSHGVTVEVQK